MVEKKDKVRKIFEDWLMEDLREEFKDIPEEDFNKSMEEGKLLVEQAGFIFKTPIVTLKEQIEAYNKWKQ
jgi:hypothetical protein